MIFVRNMQNLFMIIWIFFLGEISNGLTTLKGLALGLGDEIERQNNQLDRLGPKVGKANDHLEHQNKQMKTILRK